jgi:hypothetical protein
MISDPHEYQDNGRSFGPLIKKPGAFPGEMIETIAVSTETGAYLATLVIRITRLDNGFALAAGTKDIDEGRVKGS